MNTARLFSMEQRNISVYCTSILFIGQAEENSGRKRSSIGQDGVDVSLL